MMWHWSNDRAYDGGDHSSNFPILMFVPQKRKKILINLEIFFQTASGLDYIVILSKFYLKRDK